MLKRPPRPADSRIAVDPSIDMCGSDLNVFDPDASNELMIHRADNIVPPLIGDREIEASSQPRDIEVSKVERASGDTESIDAVANDTVWFDSDTKSFLASMLVHVMIVVGLGSYTVVSDPEILSVFIDSQPVHEEIQPLDVVNDIAYSEVPAEEIGANSNGLSDMALSMAPELTDLSEIPSVPIDLVEPEGSVQASLDIKFAVGMTESKDAIRGMTGVGETGTQGAVDRITYELLQAIEQRPTLVVWLFDSSISMVKRRKEIRDRFDRIYDQLGIVQEEKRKRNAGSFSDDSLITSVVSFGRDLQFLTKRPTSDLKEIRSAIDRIEIDESGVEMVFHAIKSVADKYKTMRPERNVVLITITDERGDDTNMADDAISHCKKFGIQSHVLGVPAPFGREFTYIKFVDPDPKFDQTPDWKQVDQGPETLVPERVQLGYQDDYFEEPVIDSGFGPYALSRMCYETGGIYFSIHPNRQVGKRVEQRQIEAFASRMSYFFSPEVMDRYRPDYLPEAEYVSRIKKSPMRTALISASKLSRVGTLDKPQLVFVKRDEPRFVLELTTAQQESARLAPELFAMCNMLAEGEKHRDKESSPRWLASFDLSYGTALAAKVRAEAYNAMLAKAKRGMSFEKPENNTWNLKPSDKIGVDSKLEKEGKTAIELLKGVVEKHAETPWALLAQRELDHKLGWEWTESYTDLSPPKKPGNRPAANNPPAPAQNEQARMLKPPPPKRQVTKI
ncbi:MAG: vWA domain-containing protein [Pirellula sp.]